MQYVTGIFALNLPSPDGTPGDWHFSGLDWSRVRVADTVGSTFGDWGIHVTQVPCHGMMPVASHVRACLDLIEQGNFGTARGMRDLFISDEAYTPTIFSKVSELASSPIWKDIDDFMGHEYFCQWLDYKEEVGM